VMTLARSRFDCQLEFIKYLVALHPNLEDSAMLPEK
jgi:hypothetical protein